MLPVYSRVAKRQNDSQHIIHIGTFQTDRRVYIAFDYNKPYRVRRSISAFRKHNAIDFGQNLGLEVGCGFFTNQVHGGGSTVRAHLHGVRSTAHMFPSTALPGHFRLPCDVVDRREKQKQAHIRQSFLVYRLTPNQPLKGHPIYYFP